MGLTAMRCDAVAVDDDEQIRMGPVEWAMMMTMMHFD